MAQDLPPGPGADLLSRACQSCHGLDTVMSEKHDVDGWRSVVGSMINNGASLTDQEADTVANYLATNFGNAPAPAASAAAPPASAGAPAASAAAPADASAAAAAPPAGQASAPATQQ
jgi:hypothetical protein